MTNSELSNEFDVLFNNITSNQAPGLNKYEKSVFLTKAQSQLVNEYFNNRTDGFGGGFDGTQKRQYDFSSITRVANLYNINTLKERITDLEKLDRRSEVFLFPIDYYLSVNEILSDERTQYSVLPINHSDYQKVMAKPYSYPPKKSAWRIFTDKKNCNYFNEYIEGTQVNYTFLSSWADQKRQLKVTIQAIGTDADTLEQDIVTGGYIAFKSTSGYTYKVSTDSSWDDTNTIYNIDILVEYPSKEQNASTSYPVMKDKDADDELIISVIKEGFSKVIEHMNNSIDDWDTDLGKTILRTDAFVNADAPSKFTNFQSSKTLLCNVKQLPIAEIIGNFKSTPTYQLRYVKTLKPIILEDLSNYGIDVSIEGLQEETECELPREMHQEILERAVTLAKIAWLGGTITQASQSKERE